MSTIRETVIAAVGNRREAEPALRALEEREQQVIEAAKREMATRGVNENEQNRILVTIGLLPEPVAETSSTSGGEDVSALKAAVDRLTQFARQHGFRG